MWFYGRGDEGVQGSGNCYCIYTNCYCIPKSISGGLRVNKYQTLWPFYYFQVVMSPAIRWQGEENNVLVMCAEGANDE